ncbi:NTP transferase domain-containing protein [Halomarina salina]|uniref:NTP transferase domain-containing protein n=1 Tax=Halomarina salina TaxID=1872699 RepID=A0ABD5RH05_9EURY|nr:NTP transferase domain-containing protein [Halomarina salina]
MCGGRGTRLDAPTEKPLFEVAGRPMVDRVTDALAGSRVDTVHAVASPHVPETTTHLGHSKVQRIDAPGEGYVADLQFALDRVERPVLTVVADLPLLAGPLLDTLLAAFEGDSTTVCVPVALKEALGASVDTAFDHDGRAVAPSGVNLVADDDTDTIHMSYDARLAVNVNRTTDADLAEALL